MQSKDVDELGKVSELNIILICFPGPVLESQITRVLYFIYEGKFTLAALVPSLSPCHNRGVGMCRVIAARVFAMSIAKDFIKASN